MTNATGGAEHLDYMLALESLRQAEFINPAVCRMSYAVCSCEFDAGLRLLSNKSGTCQIAEINELSQNT